MSLRSTPTRRARPLAGAAIRFWFAAACAFAVVAPRAAAAKQAQVITPETPVRSAPFDVAPELARAHANDRLPVQGEASGDWRRVRLPDGRFGYLRAEAVTLIDDPPPPANAAPIEVVPAPADAPEAAPAVAAPAPVAAVPPAPAAAPASPDLGAAAPAPPRPATTPALLGVMFEILPVGTLAQRSSTASQNANRATDSVFAVAVAPFLDLALSPYFALGASPQVVFRVKGDGVVGQSATEFDLRARATGRAPLSSRVAVFGRLSPAYSIVQLPSSTRGAQTSDPAGFLLDLSVGSEVALLPNLFLIVDLGYQVGFQTLTAADGSSVDGTRYLHLGAGLAVGL